MPKITVIMNCYNGAEFVRAAIESVYAQTFTDWEIVFWDNASTDGTASIAKSYDARLRYFCSEKNVPLGHARRLAMEKAQGEWIGFLDADDLWFPEKLQTQVAAIEASKATPVLCYAGVREQLLDGTMIREVLPRSKSGDIFPEQLVQFDINMVTPLLNSAKLQEYRLAFDDRIRASEEYNLFMRLLAKGPACVVSKCLGISTIRPASLTSQAIDHWAAERRLTLATLEAENTGLRSRYRAAFSAALARAAYYDARRLADRGDFRGAQSALRNVKGNGLLYAGLFVLSYFPQVWRLVHEPVVKRRIGRILNRMLR